MKNLLLLISIILLLNLGKNRLFAQSKEDCPYQIEQSNHFLLVRDMNSQSTKFTKDITIEKDKVDSKFNGTQYTKVRSSQILTTFTEDCDGGYVPALKVFYGLDIDKKQIKLYFTKASLGEPIAIGGGDYYMDVSPTEMDVKSFMGRNTTALYEVNDQGDLVNIIGNESKRLEAVRFWMNYVSYIKIDRRLVGERNFDLDCRNKGRCDPGSVLFPTNVVHSLVKDNGNASFLYFNSGVRTETGSLRHCVTISTFPPLSEPPPPGAGIFSGNAVNMSQLCPTKCGSIIVNIVEEKCRIKN